MMNKNFKIFGVRSGMIGDTIMALPVLNYLEILHPNSYKYWVIGKRFSQASELYINHPLIDKIHILETPEKLESNKDIDVAKQCNVVFDITPQHPDGTPCIDCFWWNDYSLCEETFRMAGLNVDDYRRMPDDLKKPRLEKWFNYNTHKKTIGIWGFAGYSENNNFTRNPSPKWWREMIEIILSETDYKIFQFGSEKEPDFSLINNDRVTRYNALSFFDQVKMSLGCDICINTDSGSGWVLGAYGHPQISLLSIHATNHIKNFKAFAPENHKNNNISLFGDRICDNIDKIKLLNLLK
jgi:ADP-heptose:LPS heptosyltransferase